MDVRNGTAASNSDLTGIGGPESTATQDVQKAGRSETAGAQSSPTSDRVELSSGLGRLAQTISNYGANRAAQVQQLAALYQSGGYRPDSLATGRAMVTEALGGGAD